MDQNSIEAIADLAVRAEKTRQLDTHTPAMLVRTDAGDCIESLEAFQAQRSRFRGVYRTQVLGELAAYVTAQHENANAQSQGFIDPDKMAATVFFNLGDASSPGHADHTATLALKPTAAYAALKSRPTPVQQRKLAEWLEDWRDHIQPIGADESAINLVQAIAAIRDVTIDTARSETHTVHDFGGSRSAMESVDAKSKLTLPAGFDFTCTPYEGLHIRTFRLRLGVITSDEKLHFTLRLLQEETHAEAVANDFRDVLTDALGTACQVRIGTFAPNP